MVEGDRSNERISTRILSKHRSLGRDQPILLQASCRHGLAYMSETCGN